MTPWTETVHCRSKSHCVACRGDRAFRESLHAVGLTDRVEFECPFGMKPPAFRMAFRKAGCGPCAPIVVEGTPV